MRVSAIAAVAENRVIGKDNDLPWHLPADLKWFKSVTKGHHVIMGRKNYEAMRAPLPNRTNIVVTRQKDFKAEGCIVVHSIEEGIEIARKNNEDEVFIIGGSEIYKQSLDLLDRLYITWIHAEFEGDVYFPEVDLSRWKIIKKEEHQSDEKNKWTFTICIYERK